MIRLYGIKHCDTVHKAHKWLVVKNIDIPFMTSREDGLTKKALTVWGQALGWEVLLNRRSTNWRQLPKQNAQA